MNRGRLHQSSWLAVCLLTALANKPAVAAEAALEAALIYRLVQYSEWPAPQPPVYCVAQDIAVQQALQQMLGPASTVRLVKQPRQSRGCHVLYLSNQLQPQPDWQPVLQQTNLLSIAANAELFALGAIFGLIQDPQQLAFRVNLTLARSREYQLNTRMLRLAKELY